MELDTSAEFGQRVQRRLREEQMIWLVTVRPDGTPQPTPVWFWWGGADEIVIYSKPGQAKLRNLAANPAVALHLDGDGRGGDVIVLTGHAAVEPEGGVDGVESEYAAKYAAGIGRIGLTPDTMGQTYSARIRVHVTRVSGH
jgi:PPOX class probable F420-dependent enzyme